MVLLIFFMPKVIKKVSQGSVLFATLDTWLLWKLTKGQLPQYFYDHALLMVPMVPLVTEPQNLDAYTRYA